MRRSAIKYELKPNRGQVQKLNQSFGNCRFVYNWALDRKKKAYEEDGTSLSAYDIMKELTQLKKEEATKWLGLTGITLLQQKILDMERAYNNFFRTKKGYPKFKSRRSKQSFRIPSDVKVNYENYTFFVPKIGWVKFYRDKEVFGKFKNATVSKTPSGRIFVSIQYETTEQLPHGKGAVGVDLGLTDLAITSDGEVFESQKHLRQSLAKLRREQRSLQRKHRKGAEEQSKNYQKQRLRVTKVHEKVAKQRKDTLHKVTTALARQYETVCIEDLNVEGLVKNPNLSLAINDAGWGMFRQMLSYKVKDLRVIGRFEPSSKTCNHCGFKNDDLKLHHREWTCECGELLDRDLNAARNIRDWGLLVET